MKYIHLQYNLCIYPYGVTKLTDKYISSSITPQRNQRLDTINDMNIIGKGRQSVHFVLIIYKSLLIGAATVNKVKEQAEKPEKSL